MTSPKHSQREVVDEYRILDLKEGDVIEVLRENSPMFEKGEQLLVIKTNNNINWKFRSLKSNKEFGFRLCSVKYPEYYNENFGWKRVKTVMKERIYEENQFFIKTTEERRALVKILQETGYKIDPALYNPNNSWIFTTKQGIIKSSHFVPYSKKPLTDYSWIIPKFKEIDTITVYGKTYIKSEYEAALSRLKPV